MADDHAERAEAAQHVEMLETMFSRLFHDFRDLEGEAVARLNIRRITPFSRLPGAHREEAEARAFLEGMSLVEPDGIEPTTSSMPLKRSPN